MYNVKSVRAKISALNNGTFLNTGTIGVSPDHVTESYFDAYREFQKKSQKNFTDASLTHADLIENIAPFFGADKHEVCSMPNATSAINTGVMGFDWKAGDHIVITEEEHPSGYIPWFYLRERYGIEVTQVKLPHNAEGIVETLAAAMTPRTRMVFVSHVSSQTGLRVPERPLADKVHAQGALLFLDGAQSAGQFPIDLHAYDCDLYATSCHKWMLGPVGTGIVYVRDTLLDAMRLSWAGPGSYFDFDNYYLGKKTFLEGFDHHAGKFDFGSRDWTKTVALARAVEFLNELGVDNIAAHVKPLTDQLKDELRAIHGVTLLTPTGDDAIHGNGIVTFRIDGMNPDHFRDRVCEERDIYLRSVPEIGGVRASVALFTVLADLELLLEEVRTDTN